MKKGFKIYFFNTRMCFGKFWEQQKNFWDKKNCVKFVSKSLHSEGGGDGVITNLVNVYIFLFLGPFSKTKWTKPALALLFYLHLRAYFLGTSGWIWRVYILSLLFMAANMSSSPYLRSALRGWPFYNTYNCVLLNAPTLRLIDSTEPRVGFIENQLCTNIVVK